MKHIKYSVIHHRFFSDKNLNNRSNNIIIGLILNFVVILLILSYCDYSAEKSSKVFKKPKTYNYNNDEEDKDNYTNQMTYYPSWDDACFEKHPSI